MHAWDKLFESPKSGGVSPNPQSLEKWAKPQPVRKKVLRLFKEGLEATNILPPSHPLLDNSWEEIRSEDIQIYEMMLAGYDDESLIEFMEDRLKDYYQWCVYKGFQLDQEKGFGGELDLRTGKIKFDDYIETFIHSVQSDRELDNLKYNTEDKTSVKLDIALTADYLARIRKWKTPDNLKIISWTDLTSQDQERIRGGMVGYTWYGEEKETHVRMRDYLCDRLPVYYQWCLEKGGDFDSFGCTVDMKTGEMAMYESINAFIRSVE
jgi:hypothetical protein